MFNLTISEIWNVVRALLDIGIVWAVIFFGLRIVRNNSRTIQIFKGILFIFIVKGIAMLIGLDYDQLYCRHGAQLGRRGRCDHFSAGNPNAVGKTGKDERSDKADLIIE